MHAERDHVVRFVFPRLREELLKRRIHLVDVDLRWGVTSEQDSLQVCKEIIDECRPRFLCMLGGRYGWTPPGRDESITAAEVRHGVLDRFGQHGYAFFYFRDPRVTETIPEEAARSGGFREFPQPDEIAQLGPREAEKIARWRSVKLRLLKRAIGRAGLQPFVYPAKWNDQERRMVGLEAFGQRVYDDLLHSIDDEFGAQPAAQFDEFAEENAAMEAFVEERGERFVLGNREPVLEELLAHAGATGGNGYMCLTGAPGSGKSALLAHLYRYLTTAHASSLRSPAYSLSPPASSLQPPASSLEPSLVIPHFVGASPGSTDVRRTLRRLCHELKAGCPDITADIPDDPEKLRVAFRDFLRQACARRRVVILLDAVNQFDAVSHSAGLHWLPQDLPESARVILSLQSAARSDVRSPALMRSHATEPPEGGTTNPALDELRRRRNPPKEVELRPLTADDGEAIIKEFLHRYRKTMTDTQRAALLSKADAGTPLYLLASLEELRTLGAFEEITRRIAELPPTTHDLFAWILERLENDEGFRDPAGRRVAHELVSRFAALLGASRYGLSQRELADLLAPGDADADPPIEPDPQGNIAALLHLLRPYLMRRGELLDFHHGQFREAVEAEYLKMDNQRLTAHRALAEYLEDHWRRPDRHAVGELPHHQIQGQMCSELALTLSDLQFVAMKCSFGMHYDLQMDYRAALAVMPEGTGISRLLDFSKAYSQEMLHLIVFADHGGSMPFAHFLFQQLRNRIWRNTEGRLDLASENQVLPNLVLLHRRPTRSSRFLRRVEGDAGTSFRRFDGTVRFSPDGGSLFVAVIRQEVLCIDPDSGRELFTLHCVGRAVALDFSPDGDRLVVGGDMGRGNTGGFVQVFDLGSRESAALVELEVPVYTLVVTGIGEVFTGSCSLVHVLDLDTMQVKRTWNPYDCHMVSAIAVNRQRTLLATGEMLPDDDDDHGSRISIWDAATMKLRGEIHGPKYGINSLAFSDLEGILVSGSCHLNNGVVAWHWQLPGTEIDDMLLSAEHRQLAFELLQVSGRDQQVQNGRIISTLETADTVNGIVCFPQSSWIVAVEGSHAQTSDAINVFNIFGSQPGNVGKICGHATVPVAVDIDCRGRWVATLHAKGEVIIWPADGLKEIEPRVPPRTLSEHFADRTCRYVLSVEDDTPRFVHITDTETGTNILSGLRIPCHKAGLVPTGEHFVRFYWNQLPMDPYFGSDGTAAGRQWFESFLSTTPVCCTLHPLANLAVSRNRAKGLPGGYGLIEILDSGEELSRKWTFSPGTRAFDICFSRDGAWGATVVDSQAMPVHIFCFSPQTGESRTCAIPQEIEPDFLIFDRDGSLCLIGVANNEKIIACFDITGSNTKGHNGMYRGFGNADQFTSGPLPIDRNRFVAVRGNNEIVCFESRPGQQDSDRGGIFRKVSEVRTHKHTWAIFALSATEDGNVLVISDGYPSISVLALPSFRRVLWRPMDQVSPDIFLNQSETRLLAIGKLADLDGLHYSVMEFPASPNG